MIERKWYRFTLNGVTYRVLATSADDARTKWEWWTRQGEPETTWLETIDD